MEILFLSNLYPWPLNNGAIQRVYHLATALARRHRVSFIAQSGLPAEELERSPLHSLCARFDVIQIESVLRRPGGPYGLWSSPIDRLKTLAPGTFPSIVRRWWSAEAVEHLKKLRQNTNFDLVWCERAHLAEAARAAGLENILVDLADLESEGLEREIAKLPPSPARALHLRELRKLERYEHDLPRRFSHVAVCKEEDRAFFRAHRDRVLVVPNGVAPQEPADTRHEESGAMIFVGSMGYWPNIEAVMDFCGNCLPAIKAAQPDAKLRIVGKEPGDLVYALQVPGQCEVVGAVPDVRPYYEQASVVLAPIRSGAGTKIKVLEALMFGKALVASRLAVEGLDLRSGIDYLEADTYHDIQSAALMLLRDEAFRSSIGARGRQRVLERYTWDSIGNDLASLVPSLRPMSQSSVLVGG